MRGYDPCARFNCYHGGSCFPTGTNKNFAECRYCDEGWTGSQCEERIPDPCENNNCADCARCVPKGNSFKCVCNGGKEGKFAFFL